MGVPRKVIRSSCGPSHFKDLSPSGSSGFLDDPEYPPGIAPGYTFHCVLTGANPSPPLEGSESWVRGEGEAGANGLEEIERPVSGLNGHVSQRAGGCQMMDGVGTSLHPLEPQAVPLPITTHPDPSHRVPFLTEAPDSAT